jgi:hypothetical protein
MADLLVVTSKIKKMVKEQGMRTSADAIEKLSQLVEAKVKAGIEKAKTGSKKTIQAIDVE